MAERSDTYYLDLLAEYEAEETAREQEETIAQAHMQLVVLGEDSVWQAGFRYVETLSSSGGQGRRRRPREFVLVTTADGRSMRVINDEMQPGRFCFDNGKLVRASVILHPDVLAQTHLIDVAEEDRTSDVFLARIKRNQALYERNRAILEKAGVPIPRA